MLPKVVKVPTKNRVKRMQNVTRIVVHHTATDNLNSVLSWFLSETSQRSAHYVIDKDGTIYQMVELTDAAWHCRGHNQKTVGIEVVSKDSPLTAQQEDSLFRLAKGLLEAFSLGHTAITAHKFMGGAHTECPGNLFADFGDVFGWVKKRFVEVPLV